MALNPRITDWQGRRVWLIGASTGIGLATAQALHRAGAQVVVSARKETQLAAFVRDHPGARAIPLDVTDAAAMAAAVGAFSDATLPDCVVYCAGHYRPMGVASWDLADALRHGDVNYRGFLYLLDALLPRWLNTQAPQPRHISIIGSVAGYRGLPQSLAYGPTKAALINLAEALYLDLRPRGIGVSLISPGFVETPLTRHNDFPMPALITPAQAAQAMLRGWAKGQFEIHFPRRFTWAMQLLRLLPYRSYFAITRQVRPRAEPAAGK